MLQAFHAAFVARAPRLHTLANPDFFLRPEFLEAAMRQVFGEIDLGLAFLVHGVVARKAAQDAAIELGDAVGHLVEEAAVVRDDDAGDVPLQQIFQRFDAVDVEMVGGLVEQHEIGRDGEGQRQRCAFALAARH